MTSKGADLPYGQKESTAEHPNVADAKRRARETGKYTRTSDHSITIFYGGEMHHIYAPDGEEVCTVMAVAGHYDTEGKPRVVDVMADRLLQHLNRDRPL